MEEGNNTKANTFGKHTFSLDSLEDCPSTPVSASSGFASGAIVAGFALQGKKLMTAFFLLVLLVLRAKAASFSFYYLDTILSPICSFTYSIPTNPT